MKGLSDFELLDAYARHGSEDAFREVVLRHVDAIFSSAMRQLRNAHLAEEATQAAFIALAGKAGRLRRQTLVAGWLHRAVHFSALKLLRSETRRRHWEGEAASMSAPVESDPVFEELALPHVDGVLAELSNADRDAIVLRFLQQKSLRDVAGALGTTEEAAKKRVSRALEKVRGLLARQGIAIPVAVLAAGLSQLPVLATPAALSSCLAELAVRTAGPVLTPGAALLAFLTGTRARRVVIFGIIVLGVSVALWLRNVGRTTTGPHMKIKLTSVMVDNQEKALRFYTETLGFIVKTDFPVGTERFLTVVSPADPDGAELLLEPMGFPPAKPYQQALHDAGIPLASFAVEDLQHQYDRMSRLGVTFRGRPEESGPTRRVLCEDTCGNLIQLFEVPAAPATSTGVPVQPSAANKVRILLTSVLVNDQSRALDFYSGILGFMKKRDISVGDGRWLTVVSPEEPEGPELLLEPNLFAPAKAFQAALHEAGIPLAAFAVEDIQGEYERLSKRGVKFMGTPAQMGSTTLVTFDDTCGNLIQLFEKGSL